MERSKLIRIHIDDDKRQVVNVITYLKYSYEEGYTTMPDEYIVEHGEAVVIMGRHSAAVLRTKKER